MVRIDRKIGNNGQSDSQYMVEMQLVVVVLDVIIIMKLFRTVSPARYMCINQIPCARVTGRCGVEGGGVTPLSFCHFLVARFFYLATAAH